MDREILLETFKQKLHLPAAPVQVQDFFAAVFCAKGCNNRHPSGIEQRFCSDPVLVFRSFPGFTFPCFRSLSVRELVSDYPYKACFPPIFAKTENIDPLHMLFFRFFHKGCQRKLFPLCIIQAEVFWRDAQDYIRTLLLCVNNILRCPISGICHGKIPFFHRKMSQGFRCMPLRNLHLFHPVFIP